jgi:hypothetical protein
LQFRREEEKRVANNSILGVREGEKGKDGSRTLRCGIEISKAERREETMRGGIKRM